MESNADLGASDQSGQVGAAGGELVSIPPAGEARASRGGGENFLPAITLLFEFLQWPAAFPAKVSRNGFLLEQ